MSPRELTGRQLEVARLVAEGVTDKRIAGQLHIAHNTVRVHVAAIAHNLGYDVGEHDARVMIARWWWQHHERKEAA